MMDMQNANTISLEPCYDILEKNIIKIFSFQNIKS